MVNNYQCTNYHVGHYCTVFTTEDKEGRPLPFAAYSHSSTAFFKLLHKLFKAYIQTMKIQNILFHLFN